METVLRGLLIGALVGLSLGPIAFWGANVRKEGFRYSSAIAFGGSAGDFVLAAFVVAALRMDGGRLAESIERFVLSFAGSPLQMAVFLVLGIILCRMDANGTTSLETVPKWRWLWALLGTVRPDTFAAVWISVSLLSEAGDNFAVLLASFYVGALLMWCGSIEVIYRVRVGARTMDAKFARRGPVLQFVGHVAAALPLTRCIGILCIGMGLVSSLPAK